MSFTDFHGDHEAFQRAREVIASEKPDFVIVAGDITNFDAELAKRFLSHLADSGSMVYFVPGNMDNAQLSSWVGSGSVRGLHGRCAQQGDITLIGLGGSPHGAFSTPNEYSEQEAAKLLEDSVRNHRSGSLVLVSHCPPRDTKIDRTMSGEHIGSISVRRFVERTQPLLVISGHVHEAQGTDTIGSSMLVNTGPAKYGNYAMIALDKTANVTFARLRKP